MSLSAFSPTCARDEVVGFVSSLIQFDTSNTGDLHTTKGEADCARWIQQQLEEVGFTTEYVESGQPNRGNVFARLAGKDATRGALLVHTHLDVVPAEPEDWSVHPFSGAVKDGYVWGRGAIDMKDMVGMAVAIARQFKSNNTLPPREIVFAFFADEEAGGTWGSQWLVEHRPDLFAGITEAVGEVGGFSLTLPTPSGEDKRLYLVEVAEKGLSWMRLTATAQPGHGSFLHENNAITILADAVARIGQHTFPTVLTDSVQEFIAAVSAVTGWELSSETPDLAGALEKIGSISRLIGATLRDTANPTMLAAGYKANVIPQTATAVIDCRVLPGRQEAFEKEIDALIGPQITREWITHLPSYETTFDGQLVDAMNAAILAHDPNGQTVPYMLSGGTDAKALARLGIRCFGFAPLQLPPELDFPSLFHGVDERVPVSGLLFGTDVFEHFLLNS